MWVHFCARISVLTLEHLLCLTAIVDVPPATAARPGSLTSARTRVLLPALAFRANNDGDYAGLELAYGKPKQPPPVQTHAMREQQLRLAAAAAAPRWPPQVQKAGVSESHSAYGSFYQAPVMAQGGQPSNGYPGQAGVVLPAVSNVYVSRVNAGSPAKLPPIAPASQAGRAEQSPARAGGQQRYPGQWVAPKGSRWW